MPALERARILRACSFVFFDLSSTFGFYSVFVPPKSDGSSDHVEAPFTRV